MPQGIGYGQSSQVSPEVNDPRFDRSGPYVGALLQGPRRSALQGSIPFVPRRRPVDGIGQQFRGNPRLPLNVEGAMPVSRDERTAGIEAAIIRALLGMKNRAEKLNPLSALLDLFGKAEADERPMRHRMPFGDLPSRFADNGEE